MPTVLLCQRLCYYSAPSLHNKLRRLQGFTPIRRPSKIYRQAARNGAIELQEASVQTVASGMLSGKRLTGVAQELWQSFVQPGDTVVDATAGNGGDTVWLANAVGAQGRVYAFDKQEKALAATKAAIQDKVGEDNLPDMIYVHGCHSTMQDTVAAQSAGLICFNLGYLPSADNRDDTATQCQTTVSAVVAALNTVGKQGLISIMAYTGHQGGQEEYEAVRLQLLGLCPARWTVTEHRYINRPAAPILIYVVPKEGNRDKP